MTAINFDKHRRTDGSVDLLSALREYTPTFDSWSPEQRNRVTTFIATVEHLAPVQTEGMAALAIATALHKVVS